MGSGGAHVTGSRRSASSAGSQHLRAELARHLCGGVLRAIIDYDGFKRREGGRGQTGKTFLQVFGGVPHRDYDRDGGRHDSEPKALSTDRRWAAIPRAPHRSHLPGPCRDSLRNRRLHRPDLI